MNHEFYHSVLPVKPIRFTCSFRRGERAESLSNWFGSEQSDVAILPTVTRWNGVSDVAILPVISGWNNISSWHTKITTAKGCYFRFFSSPVALYILHCSSWKSILKVLMQIIGSSLWLMPVIITKYPQSMRSHLPLGAIQKGPIYFSDLWLSLWASNY